ncbi:MAG: hypothetical protein ABIP20_03200 [Chthoniobacteraceae bacterium]
MNRRTGPVIPTKQPQSCAKRAKACGSTGKCAAAAVIAMALAGRADAQEIPRPSYARQVEKTAKPTLANFKVGEVLLRVDARMGVDFVDNVDLTPNGKADLIVTPEIGVNATWAVTKLNTLQFRLGFGYAYYLNSPNLNRQSTTISPDSALSFNVYAGDVKINFHNQFSLQQEAISQGTLSGVAQLERFTNTIGLSVLWDTNDIVWNFGYDHFNFITLGGANSSSGSAASSLSRLDHSTDQLNFSAAVKINSALIGGLEATAAYSDYPQQSASNFTGLSAGPYLEFQLTKYTHVFLSGGYKGYFSGANAPGSVSVSDTVAAQAAQGDPTGFYANLSFVHRLNRYYSDRLDIGHTDDVEGLSGHTQVNSARYAATWRVNQRLTLSAGLFYEDVRIVSGSALGGSVASDFTRVGGSIGTGFVVSEHVSASLSYQYVNKSAVRAAEDYSQNRVTFSLGYRF